MNQQHATDDILAPTGGNPTIAGGARTEPQSADDLMERSLNERADDGAMQQDQMAGDIGQQTVDLKPSAGNPEHGLPSNPTGSENTGGANPNEESETDDESQKKTLNDAADADMTRAVVENDEKFLALAAEFQNYRNAANRRVEEARERAARNVLEDLLPVLDNLETGLKYVRDAKDAESMKQGIEFIAQQFRDVIKNHGVEAIEAQGQTFDPLRHDALEEVPSDQPEGTVVEETQRGYSYKGAVLRPSRVRVAGK